MVNRCRVKFQILTGIVKMDKVSQGWAAPHLITEVVTMTQMQIRRIYRSHSSCVVTLTKPTLRHLGAKRGDYLIIEHEPGNGSVIISKVKIKDKSEGETNGAS
ncbi:hypothetical protein ES705_10963 [subsurface metagenome]